MIVIENVTSQNNDCGLDMTAFPYLWHIFYTHIPQSSKRYYEAENFVISYAFHVRKDTSKYANRCEIWLKGGDASYPFIYAVYHNSLFYLPKFSPDYTRIDDAGNGAIEIEYTRDNILRFLTEEFFVEKKTTVFVRPEYVNDPAIHIDGEIENA